MTPNLTRMLACSPAEISERVGDLRHWLVAVELHDGHLLYGWLRGYGRTLSGDAALVLHLQHPDIADWTDGTDTAYVEVGEHTRLHVKP